MRPAVLIPAVLGLVLLIGATLAASGYVSVQHGGWLLPGGLTLWLIAWIFAGLTAP